MRLVRTAPRRYGDGNILVSVSAGTLLLLGRFFPFDRVPLTTCPLRRWAHLPCPTCGMTRAFMRFTRGQWASAIHVSPLGTLLAVLAVAAALYGLLRVTVLGRGFEVVLTPRESTAWRVGLVVAVLANWTYLIVSGAATS